LYFARYANDIYLNRNPDGDFISVLRGTACFVSCWHHGPILREIKRIWQRW